MPFHVNLKPKTQLDTYVDPVSVKHFYPPCLISQGPDGPIELPANVLDSDWDTYCRDMARDRQWADAVVLVAMAHMLNRDIVVITSSPQGYLYANNST